jgi:hypothetical protein
MSTEITLARVTGADLEWENEVFPIPPVLCQTISKRKKKGLLMKSVCDFVLIFLFILDANGWGIMKIHLPENTNAKRGFVAIPCDNIQIIPKQNLSLPRKISNANSFTFYQSNLFNEYWKVF